MKQIRIVVVGLGLRATWGVEAILACPELKLAAIVEPIAARRTFFADEFGLRNLPAFESLAKCLMEVDFDAVAVFVPDSLHAEVVLPALKANKYVFVEKPLDASRNAALSIVQADQKAGGRTFVGFNLRYAPVYLTIKRLISDGVVGRILTVQADEFYDGGRTYFRRWNRLREMGGGLWITKACHDFDLLCWLIAARPQRVFATGSLEHYRALPDAAMYCRDCARKAKCPDRFDRHVAHGSAWERLYAVTEAETGQRADLCLYNSHKDTLDHGAAVVDFAGGIVATYTLNVVAGFTNRRLRVSGTKGTLDGDLAASTVTLLRRDPPGMKQYELRAGAGSHGGADGWIFPAFAKFVRGKANEFVSPAEAMLPLEIGWAAQQSMESGHPVNVSSAQAVKVKQNDSAVRWRDR